MRGRPPGLGAEAAGPQGPGLRSGRLRVRGGLQPREEDRPGRGRHHGAQAQVRTYTTAAGKEVIPSFGVVPAVPAISNEALFLARSFYGALSFISFDPPMGGRVVVYCSPGRNAANNARERESGRRRAIFLMH